MFRRVRAVELWRRMLTMLFETGHPWITFKDPCNLRSPQQHDGVVHSSNLCTEITLNTSRRRGRRSATSARSTWPRTSAPDGLDAERLRDTVHTAVRMLDNVIDINFYTIPRGPRASNLRHRPVGLGLMGFPDALFTLRHRRIASDAAVEFADRCMEQISYHAIDASTDLAAERGRYAVVRRFAVEPRHPADRLDRSCWPRPRGDGDSTSTDRQRLDWDALREQVRATGMRNSNVMAIAPTATISNICGVEPVDRAAYRNLFVKSNMSGDFTVVNPYLVADLKARGLWDEVMVVDLKYFDGSLGPIDRIPADLQGAVRDRVRDRRRVAGRGGVAAAEVDRPGAVAEPLRRRAERPGARRALPAGVARWPQDDLLPALAVSATHVEKSTLQRHRRPAQRRRPSVPA